MTYRKIETKLWGDSKVEGLSGTATYLLLYLLTAPNGNIAGCYEVTTRHIARDMKLKDGAVRAAMKELCDSNIVEYCVSTNEVLVKNWTKYNLSKSKTLVKPFSEALEAVKSEPFRAYLRGRFEELFGIPYEYTTDTVSTPYEYPIDTHSVSVSVTDTVSVNGIEEKPETFSQVETRAQKHRYGEFSNVLLTDKELEQLKERFPDWQKRIDDLSYYIGSKGDKYKSHYRTILSWQRKDEPKGVSSKNAKYD